MIQSLSISNWVNLIDSGKSVRFSKRKAKKVLNYAEKYCDFKITYSENQGKLILKKSPFNFNQTS